MPGTRSVAVIATSGGSAAASNRVTTPVPAATSSSDPDAGPSIPPTRATMSSA